MKAKSFLSLNFTVIVASIFGCQPQLRRDETPVPAPLRSSQAAVPLPEKPSGEIGAKKSGEEGPFLVGVFQTPSREEMERAIRVFQLNRSGGSSASEYAWDPFLEAAFAYLEQPARKLSLDTLMRMRVAAEFELDAERLRQTAAPQLEDAVSALLVRIDQKVEILRAAARRGEYNPAAGDERLPCWPLAYGLITSGFGERRDPFEPDKIRFHAALDIAAAPREPVHAVLGGIVVEAGWKGNFGRYVRIRHSEILQSIYAHLEVIMVKEGQEVTRGGVIGLLGNTGRSTGYHLHFGMFENGKAVDPLKLLPEIPLRYSDLLPGVSFGEIE